MFFVKEVTKIGKKVENSDRLFHLRRQLDDFQSVVHLPVTRMDRFDKPRTEQNFYISKLVTLKLLEIMETCVRNSTRSATMIANISEFKSTLCFCEIDNKLNSNSSVLKRKGYKVKEERNTWSSSNRSLTFGFPLDVLLLAPKSDWSLCHRGGEFWSLGSNPNLLQFTSPVLFSVIFSAFQNYPRLISEF